MKDKEDAASRPINCFLCRYFYITYEKKFPYGCRVMGFKSKRLPSIDVFNNSDMDCSLFMEKEKT
ncbi:MAG TPA: hypothetical protein PKZ12_02170 [Smithellaceae bacterium]|nr:hypothetical protein [Smithellaceae bacterium]